MMVEFLNKIRIHAMVSAIMYLAAGVLLLVWPETASSVIAMIVCAVLLACGIAELAIFIFSGERTLYSAVRFLSGLTLVVVAFWLFKNSQVFIEGLHRVAGVLLLIHGLTDAKHMYDLRKNESSLWAGAGILTILTLIAGAVLVFFPFKVYLTALRVVGIFLIYDGVSDLWMSFQVAQSKRELDRRARDAARRAEAVDLEPSLPDPGEPEHIPPEY